MTARHNIAGAVVSNANPLPIAEHAMTAAAGNTGTAIANTVVTLTFAADTADRGWHLDGVEWSLSANPAAAVALTVAVDGTTVWQFDITSGGPGFMPAKPRIRGAANKAMVITLAAAGGSVIGKLNARPVLEAVT